MRQYLASEMPDKNGTIVVKGKDFKYLSQVLRLEIGNVVQVRLPDQQLVSMEVSKIQSKQMIFSSCSESDTNLNFACQGVSARSIKKSNVEYWVFQFVPKPAKMDLLIRQCVECGINNIVPVQGEFSNQPDWKNRSERWLRLVREARQQSGSPVDTKIWDCMSLEKSLELWGTTTEPAFLLHESDIADKNIFTILSKTEGKIKKAALAIGPEGGMSDSEIQLLKNAGFDLIHFKTNVLRCETACLYGIAAIQTAISEYKSWHKQE